MSMIKKILIANRGEIACRVIRTARELGIETVAVYSDADLNAMHVELADQAVHIGAAPVGESYLLGDRIIDAAKRTGADAIHPGYGFLSENPDFVDAVAKAGLIFIGPSADAIRAMGLKDKAKALMEKAGVPVVPGYHGDNQDANFLAKQANEIGYPVLIKARAGGGGKGMRLVEKPADFANALASAQREAQSSFGDPACLIEKFIQNPRHIEMQVMGDAHGNVIHLFERDCSMQRRHQKVIEEAPAPDMPEDVRQAMGAAAVAAAKAVNYQGAGTVEFIVDGSGPLRPDGFWFMEMNTRLQVEHPVTEEITGFDLVAMQIAVAEGQALPVTQDQITATGHAFEVRLYAEDPSNGFLPATGTLDILVFPTADNGVRVDTGVRQGDVISPHYDPMIAKLIVTGPNRNAALLKMSKALEELVVHGCVTNRAFLSALVIDADFAAGRVDTGLIDRKGADLTARPDPTAQTLALAALAAVRPADAEDPFANFRLWGAARQVVTFEGDPNISIFVETIASETNVTTPLGEVTFSAVLRNGPELWVEENGVKSRAIVHKTGHGVLVQTAGHDRFFKFFDPSASASSGKAGALTAPMPGNVIAVVAKAGDSVSEGDRLLVMEAMKMEHAITAAQDGVIAEMLVSEGDQVEQGALLVRMQEDE
ncbi:3-methylcrotonoyl-CoA carboxylase, alpha subunit [Thalassococcus halodurans]|uniref:3-methylcrotonoyl-CoA carboxylase, alpha subunit n=2 Tax=Thalassococcus halodurans TaxID=373675 RepID=A0A1H5XC84_9RHOB|nr:3-methylcrotonoyl-CoA carboxylase, alpha subunit [Thalassococcus halodurans]